MLGCHWTEWALLTSSILVLTLLQSSTYQILNLIENHHYNKDWQFNLCIKCEILTMQGGSEIELKQKLCFYSSVNAGIEMQNATEK